MTEIKPEWVFRVFTKPPGLVVEHGGETHSFSEKELRDIMRGWLEREYYKIEEVETEVVEYLPLVYLSRYKWLPKYLYPRFVKAVCEAFGIPYSGKIVESLLMPPVEKKAVIEIREPTVWEKAEKRAKELSKRYERLWEEIEALEKFYKEVMLRRKK